MTNPVNVSLVSGVGVGVGESVDYNSTKENFSQNISVQDNACTIQDEVYKDISQKIHKENRIEQKQERLFAKTGVYSIWSVSSLLNCLSLVSSKIYSVFQTFAGAIGTVPSQLSDVRYSWRGFVDFIKENKIIGNRKNFSILMMEKFFPFIRDVVVGTVNVFFKSIRTAAVWSGTAKTILAQSAVALTGTIFGFATGCFHVVAGFLAGISAHLRLRAAEADSEDYNKAKDTRKHALKVFSYGTALTVLGALTLAGIGGPFTLAASAGCAALYMAYLASRAKTTAPKSDENKSQNQEKSKDSIEKVGYVSEQKPVSTEISQSKYNSSDIKVEDLLNGINNKDSEKEEVSCVDYSEYNENESGLGSIISKYQFGSMKKNKSALISKKP